MLGAILGGGLSLLGSLGSSFLGNSSNNKTNQMNWQIAQYQGEQNQKLQNQAYQQNVDMYNRNNAYNSPSAQMARLKSADLNPNLVYGTGAVGNTSGHVPEMKAAQMQTPTMKPYQGWNLGLGEAFQTFQQAQMNKAQRSQLEAQTSFTNQQAVSEGLKQAETMARTARSKFDLDLAQQMKDLTMSTAEANLNNIYQNTSSSASSQRLNEQREAQNKIMFGLEKQLAGAQLTQVKMATARLVQDMNFAKFEQDLKRIGIYPHDSLFARLLSRGVSVLKEGWDNLR